MSAPTTSVDTLLTATAVFSQRAWVWHQRHSLAHVWTSAIALDALASLVGVHGAQQRVDLGEATVGIEPPAAVGDAMDTPAGAFQNCLAGDAVERVRVVGGGAALRGTLAGECP